MQRFILSRKNHITLINAFLIVTAFVSKFALGNVELFNWALIIASVVGVAPIAIQAYQALRVKVVSIDVLVTIAVVGALLINNYEESAIVTFLFLFGAYLEQRTLTKTRSAIKELTEMAPESAWRQTENGEFEEVDIDEVDVGDILLVKTGAKVPVDGTVLTGEGHINEASITGEPIPVSKKANAQVYAGTILENGTIQIVANRVGEDTTLAKSLSWLRKRRIPNQKPNVLLINLPSTTRRRCWPSPLLYGWFRRILNWRLPFGYRMSGSPGYWGTGFKCCRYR